MSQCLRGLSVFVLAAARLLAQPMIPATDTRTTGVIGIASGETARFNVLNDHMADAATTNTCSAVLTYYGADGTALKTSTVSVSPGTAGYLDLFSSSDLSLGADQRKQIRATFAVLLIPNTATGSPSTSISARPPANVPECRLIGTLEILDAVTGRTLVILSGTHKAPSEIAPVATSSKLAPIPKSANGEPANSFSSLSARRSNPIDRTALSGT
jgi:hypothetical protein